MINYVKGDATRSLPPALIPHCCNDVGRFGAGFALAVAKRWPHAKDMYLAWYRSETDLPGVEVTGRIGLGESQLIEVAPSLWVVNIIGQHGVGVGSGGRPPIRYDALKKGLQATARWAKIHKASVHMPRIGSGLAGGHWGNIETMIKTEIVNRGVEVTVYFVSLILLLRGILAIAS